MNKRKDIGQSVVASRRFSAPLLGLRHFELVEYVGVSLFLISVALLVVWLLARQAAKLETMIAPRRM